MTTSLHPAATTVASPVPPPSGAATSVVLAAAFTLSAAFTVITTAAGTADPSFAAGPPRQTTFGWFENDVYTGLLMIALYLTVGRLVARRANGR